MRRRRQHSKDGTEGRSSANRSSLRNFVIASWTVHPWLYFLAASAVWVALLYGKSLSEPFVYDDVAVIQHNPALSSWHDALRYFRSPVQLNNEYRGFAGSIYRPLTWLGFLINHKLSGSNAVGFHITNLILHWANGAIGFFLLRKLGISAGIASATGLIWLGLPINCEAVAWISGRHTCQATFFILLTLLAAVCYLRKSLVVTLLGYTAALVGALFSNEWGVLALPLTALFIYIERPQNPTKWLPLLAGAAAATVLELSMRQAAGAYLPNHSLRILPVGLTVAKYVAWTILPVHMSVERSTDAPANSMTLASISALAALFCLLVMMALKLRTQAPRLAAGLAWLLIGLQPFCGIVFIYQGMAERYTYLASGGLAFSVLVLAERTNRRGRSVVLPVILLWVAWGAWRLNARVLDWGDQTTLFRSSLETNPRSPVLLYNLGLASAEAGDVQQAITYYRRALEIRPDYLNVLVNLGNLLREQGSYAAALAVQQHAIAVGPQTADLWVNLGDTYLKSGSVEKAVDAFNKAALLDPMSTEAAINLGATFQSMGQFAAAEQQYNRAISIDSHQGAAYCNLGALLLREGNVGAATDEFKKGIAADGSYDPAYFDLGLVYESSGRRDLAVPMFERVLKLKPGDANAELHLRRLQGQ